MTNLEDFETDIGTDAPFREEIEMRPKNELRMELLLISDGKVLEHQDRAEQLLRQGLSPAAIWQQILKENNSQRCTHCGRG